jgi:hypothetical protein
MKKFILPLIALAALVFGVGSVVRTQPKHEVTLPPSPPPASPYSHTVAAVGLVETSTENIAIGTPLADVVSEVLVKVNQTVEAGDALPLFVGQQMDVFIEEANPTACGKVVMDFDPARFFVTSLAFAGTYQAV